MKGRIHLLAMSVLVIAATASCKKPKACVQPSTAIANLGEEVTFMDCSESAYNYRYDFGDGTPRVEQQTPIHKYTSPGSYEVKVQVSNKNDRQETEASYIIKVKGVTEGDFTTGKWILYKKSKSDDLGLYVDQDIQTPMHEYTFTSDSVFVYDGFGLPDAFPFDITGENRIEVNGHPFLVVRNHNNELWYRTEDFGEYIQYYFKKM